MASSGMLHRVALVRTDVNPDEGGAKFLRNSILIRATRCNISEDAILHGLKVFLQTQSRNFMDNYYIMMQELCCFFHLQVTSHIIGCNSRDRFRFNISGLLKKVRFEHVM
jgi:hypothetical protein